MAQLTIVSLGGDELTTKETMTCGRHQEKSNELINDQIQIILFGSLRILVNRLTKVRFNISSTGQHEAHC